MCHVPHVTCRIFFIFYIVYSSGQLKGLAFPTLHNVICENVQERVSHDSCFYNVLQGIQIQYIVKHKTSFRCSLPMEFGDKMSDFEASKKRNATTGKVKNIF